MTEKREIEKTLVLKVVYCIFCGNPVDYRCHLKICDSCLRANEYGHANHKIR